MAMQKIKSITFLYLPPILWCALIFYLSSKPNLKISEGALDLVLRKIGHIGEYFVLTILVSRATAGSIFKINKKSIISGIIFSFLFALSDEYHQTFVEGREGALRDVGIDSIGVLLSSFSLFYFRK